MLGFTKLQEKENALYPYQLARKVSSTYFYVIDMPTKNDTVMTFTQKTENIKKQKRVWFGTLTGLKGKKGGKIIRDMGDSQSFAKTSANVINDFFTDKNALSVMMRVSKKDSGRAWDIEFKKALKAFQLKSESTKIVNGEKTDFTFFVISKMSFDTSSLTESLDASYSDMLAEPEPASRVEIYMTSKDFLNNALYTPYAVDKYAIESPPMIVSNSNKYSLGARTDTDRRISLAKRNLEPIKMMSDDKDVLELVSAASHIVEMQSTTPEQVASLILNYINKVEPTEQNKKHINAVMGVVSESISDRSTTAHSKLVDDLARIYETKLTVTELAEIEKYCNEDSYKISRQQILLGAASPITDNIDAAFSKVGVNMSNVTPNTMLYRGMSLPKHIITDIIKSRRYSTLTFMSTSSNPTMAISYANEHVYDDIKSDIEPMDMLVNSKNSKSDVIDVLNNSNIANIGVVFIIEPKGVPVLLPYGSEYPEECEFIVNRGTVFECEFINCTPNGSHVVVKLKLVNDRQYSESIVDFVEEKESASDLEELAAMLSILPPTNTKSFNNYAIKQAEPVF